MLGYEISVRCICGQETKYKLNALRFPIITLGRKQDEKITLPDVNICSDDGHNLSRFMLYFAYDQNLQDWVVGAGFPIEKYLALNPELNNCDAKTKADENRNKKRGNLFYLRKDKLFNILDKKYSKIGNEVLVCGEDFSNAFIEFTDKPIPLSNIAGIGVIPCSVDSPVQYNGQKINCVKHPLLGQLPFGWYIEISANRTNNTVLKSFINKSTVLQG